MKNLLDSQIRDFLKKTVGQPSASFLTPIFMTNHLFKMMGFMAAFAGMQAAVSVQAAVNLISVERHIWGNAGSTSYDETHLWENSGQTPYGGSGFLPLSDNVSAGIDYATSSASDWSLNAYRYGNGFAANAYAQTTYQFRPGSGVLSISLNGVIGVWWFENEAKMELKHVASNTLVSSYYSPSYSGVSPFSGGYFVMANYPFNWSTTLDLEPTDLYQLVVFVRAKNGEGGAGSASLNLSIVPEPSAMLMAGMAALFMCGRRLRPKAMH